MERLGLEKENWGQEVICLFSAREAKDSGGVKNAG